MRRSHAHPIVSFRLPNGRLIGLTPDQPIPAYVIHINPDRHYRHDVRVEIYRTLAELRTAVRCGVRASGMAEYKVHGLLGYCEGVEEYFRRKSTGRRWRSRTCAVIKLAQTNLRTGTLTHECFHATLRYAERVGLGQTTVGDLALDGTSSLVRDQHPHSEERLATVHGNLCRGLISELYTHKLLKD
jgi:hypothetical protein